MAILRFYPMYRYKKKRERIKIKRNKWNNYCKKFLYFNKALAVPRSSRDKTDCMVFPSFTEFCLKKMREKEEVRLLLFSSFSSCFYK